MRCIPVAPFSPSRKIARGDKSGSSNKEQLSAEDDKSIGLKVEEGSSIRRAGAAAFIMVLTKEEEEVVVVG